MKNTDRKDINPESGPDPEACVEKCISIPEIFLPSNPADMASWPVIACDQYTSDPNYWKSVERRTKNRHSAYHMVLPEIYLEEPYNHNLQDRISNINRTMEDYLKNNILKSIGNCFVYIDRQTPLHKSRKGLLMAIDLEEYDYDPNRKALVRATEGTILERIPPRTKIRRKASLELPHVQLLVDDPEKNVVEPLEYHAQNKKLQLLYDMPLPEGGGHIRGYKVPENTEYMEEIFSGLINLKSLKNHGLLFAVGDGNHSLATAKAHWESIRNQVGPVHPARYALAELINIYDEGLEFEPIHRVLFNARIDDFVLKVPKLAKDAKVVFSEEMPVKDAIKKARSIEKDELPVPVFSGNKGYVASFHDSSEGIATGAVDKIIDAYISMNNGCRVDYIHGENEVSKLAEKNIGFLLPDISKESFFSTIISEGVFPRKTFSMGESFEKRYYIESRLIR